MASGSVRAVELRLARLLAPNQTLLSIISPVAIPRPENAGERKMRLKAAQDRHGTIPKSEVDRTPIVYDERHNVPAEFVQFGIDEFRVVLSPYGRAVNIPYAGVVGVWRQLDNRVGLHLNFRIVIPPDPNGYTYLLPL